MISRGSLVALFLLTGVPGGTRANGDQVGGAECILQTPAPKGSARLQWRAQNGSEGAPGFWISDDAMKRIAIRQTACTNGWTQCQVDLATEQGKKWTPGWKSWVIGIGSAIVVGYVAGRFYR